MGKKLVATWACRCGESVSTYAKDPNISLIPDRFKCWVSGCRFYLTRSDKLPPGGSMHAAHIYQRLSGLGTQTESQCGTAALRKLLYGQKIVEVAMESVSKTRSLVTSMRLENGKTIHFAPSTKGVTIYKVTDE